MDHLPSLAHLEAGQGRPLILLHAFPLDKTMWQPQLAAFAVDHRVLCPDLPGFGQSPPLDGTPGVDRMADAVARFIDAKGIDVPVILGGLSMGGYVAMAFARRHADRLAALILADTRAEADSAEAKATREQMIELAGTQPEVVIDRMLPKLLGGQTARQRPDLVATVRRIGAGQTSADLVSGLQALRDRPDATEGLARLKVPTLVIVGKDDVLTPPEVARHLAECIEGAQLTVIEGAGHLSNLEQDNAFNEAVRSFLNLQMVGDAQ